MRKISNTKPSKYRLWYNDWITKNAKGKVLDVGKSSQYDYGFITIDTNHNPDIIGDICNSSIPDNSFDIVLCNGMYEWVDDPQKMVDEVLRIAKKKAIFGLVGKDYPPYRDPWQYYTKLDFKGTDVERKNFNKEYHFVICNVKSKSK